MLKSVIHVQTAVLLIDQLLSDVVVVMVVA